MSDHVVALLIGSGAREHAIAWKLLQSKRVAKLHVAPGNGGFSFDSRVNLHNIKVDDFPSLLALAQNEGVQLVVVGPEVPLVAGISEVFRKQGILVFGPSKRAAQLEGSKVFAKDFMKRHNIPTAAYETFTNHEEAQAYLKSVKHRVVIKASGLAAGKGVVVPLNTEEASQALKRMMCDREFGDAADQVVIEEFIDGEETSVMAFSDGHTVVAMPPAQDHKRAHDNDEGPNTGGMGAVAPAPSNLDIKKIVRETIQPVIDGMRREGVPYVGVLFAGLMIDSNKNIKVLEYNCRFGDPETQTVLPLLSDECDLLEIMLACVEGHLDSVNVKFKDEYSVSVVAASGGYPGSYKNGKEITITKDETAQSMIFHAGTSSSGDKILTNGGRVLSVVAVRNDLKTAIEAAYTTIKRVTFDGMFHRNDIGRKALSSQTSTRSVSYADAGVDIERGDAVVESISKCVKDTARPGADSELGGFGALFDTRAAGFVDPILVSGTDGVGTKLMVARAANEHSYVGQDLVAMCVNDILTNGAEPLFFLDYFATGKIDVETAANVIKGIARACKLAGCALVGGETAEMPGMYGSGEYDLAGFAVGAVERNQMLPRNVCVGDVVIGLASSGVHSNGFSLVRFLVTSQNLQYTDEAPFEAGTSLGSALLRPTKIYVKSCLAAIRSGPHVKALAHITGGGLTENVPRVIPDDMNVEIDVGSWPETPLFAWLRKIGNLSSTEVFRTFNSGIGMVLIVDKNNVDPVIKILETAGEQVYTIGRVTKGSGKAKVVYPNL